MQDLLALKAELEKPGIGKRRHNLAEEFKGRADVPIEWIQEWINAKWYILGCKYLWLAAINACIGRPDAPLGIIEQGLNKTDMDTFNAAIKACRGRNIPFEVIACWYDTPRNTIMQLAAMNACFDNPDVPDWFAKQALHNPDIRVRRLAEKLLEESNSK